MFILSCRQSSSNQNDDNGQLKQPLTKEDSIYNEVIDIHDEVMPKMGKLIGYQKKAQYYSDSAKQSMQKHSMPGLKEYKQQMDSLIYDLKAAEKAMNDWMEQFNPDPKLPTTEEKVAYFQEQKARALKMKEQFYIALEKGKRLLNE